MIKQIALSIWAYLWGHKTEKKIERKFVFAWWDLFLLVLLIALIIYWITD